MIPNRIEQAILITNPKNLRYLNHLPMAQGAILLSGDQKVFYSWGRFLPEQVPEGLEVRPIPPSELGKEVAAELKKSGEKSLLAEKSIPYELYRQLEEQGTFEAYLQEGVVEGWREIKEEWEISQLAEASRITDLAFSKILDDLRPGLTELEVAAKLEYYMRLEGCEEFNKTIVASGIHSAKPHHWPTKKTLAQGEFVTMDYGCTVNGYHSDMTRTVVLGKASDEQKSIYQTVKEAQERAREELRAGKTSDEMDKIARDIIDGSKYQGCFLHNLGHGIGLDIHEGTGLVKGSEARLLSGMVVSIEPGIYVKDFGGVRIEDIAVIEQNGCKVLEHSDRALIEVS